MTTATHKVCASCFKVKTRSEFYPHNTSKDGKRSWCKKCDYARRKKKPHRKRLPPTVQTHKACTQCNEIKPIDEFGIYRAQKITQRRPACKKCHNGYKNATRRFIKRFRDIAENKTCTTCKVNKPASEFNINNSLSGRLHCYCRDCDNRKKRKAYKNRPTKECRMCENTKPRVDFPRNEDSADNRWHICKECFDEHSVNYGNVDALIEKIRDEKLEDKIYTAPQTQICTKCNEEKDITKFYLISAGNRYMRSCKECQNKGSLARYYASKKNQNQNQ